jgi:hypothetical protein
MELNGTALAYNMEGFICGTTEREKKLALTRDRPYHLTALN